MWPFRKPPTPPSEPQPPTPFFATTTLQTGDECVCRDDEPHRIVHQKLLELGRVYTVREVTLGGKPAKDGFSGPWIRLVGITPIYDKAWACNRFEKVSKTSIISQVSQPADLDIEKEREDAY